MVKFLHTGISLDKKNDTDFFCFWIFIFIFHFLTFWELKNSFFSRENIPIIMLLSYKHISCESKIQLFFSGFDFSFGLNFQNCFIFFILVFNRKENIIFFNHIWWFIMIKKNKQKKIIKIYHHLNRHKFNLIFIIII